MNYKKRDVISSEKIDTLVFYNMSDYSNIKHPVIFIKDYLRIRSQNFNSLISWKEHIIKLINIIGIEAGEVILFAPLNEILNIYKKDKMVRYNFCEKDRYGINRNSTEFPSAPREIIVRLDHPSYAIAFFDEWEREILLTLLHEVGQLLGIETDDEAESYAIEKVNTIYNQPK